MRVVLGVSGGIAAYKAPDLVRRLRDRGGEVRIILTENATRFVSPLSIAAVGEHGVITSQWGDPSSGGVDHVAIARWADVLLIAPATANVIGKLARGIADDALTTYALAHRTRVVIAPAMNTFMLRHPAVQENLEILRGRGVEVVDPDAGELACGDVGDGRMPDPDVLARYVIDQRSDLAGVRVLITAGPTREPLDPVRFLTNRSSGRMGYALAAVAQSRGASVTLVSGPVSLDTPSGVHRIDVTTASEMYEATLALAAEADVVIGTAAVADYEPVEPSGTKIRRVEGEELTLRLKPTRDVIGAVGELSPRPFLVAFAAETGNVEESAGAKLRRKNADLIVANDVSDSTIGFDVDHNRVTILASDGSRVELERASKTDIAGGILDQIVARRSRRSTEPAIS